MYSTHAQRAEVATHLDLGREARALLKSFVADALQAVVDEVPCPQMAAPSSGVLRLATNGARPYAIRADGSPRAPWRAGSSSSTSASVSLGHAEHHVDLQRVELVVARELGRANQVLGLGRALDDTTHPFTRAIGRDRERAIATAREQADQLVVELIGAQTGDADLATAIDDRAHDAADVRMIGDRRADQADATRVRGNRIADRRAVDDAHAAIGRATHHAIRATARATACRLGHEHVGELGVRRDDHRARGEQ